MQLQQRHIDALNNAETLMFHFDFCPYLELKTLLQDASPHARARFRTLFSSYYALNVGGLTEAFKDRFFAILFTGNIIVNGLPDYPTILNELSSIPRRKGDCAMPFSFVSKLVAIRCEKSPIYDRHVVKFFGWKVPEATVPKANRIDWFVGCMNEVAADYSAWAEDKRMTPILDRFKARDRQLAQCDNIRLVDFLVWKVGKEKLL